MSAVCLTACSTLYAAKENKPVTPQFALTEAAKIPDIPPQLKACVEQKPKAGKTADEMVINRMEADRKRAACAAKILEWHRGVQAANGPPPAPEKKAAAKPVKK